jgi:transcriptional regulator with XRE-family HTH domain
VKLPTGHQLAAARALAGLQQQQLAKLAGVNPSTVNRMEASGAETARGQIRSVQAVIDALAKRGVEITTDGGVRPIEKKR